jgi:hypothetical protein
MGRYVVGIGVAGSTSGALVAACNEFIDYAELPGVTPGPKKAEPAKKSAAKKTTAEKATAKKATAKKAPAKKAAAESPAQADATALLVRAMRVRLQKSDDEWVYASGVKSQMQRTNAAFNEKSLGYSTFRAFVESRADVVESKVDGNGQLMVRLP